MKHLTPDGTISDPTIVNATAAAVTEGAVLTNGCVAEEEDDQTNSPSGFLCPQEGCGRRYTQKALPYT